DQGRDILVAQLLRGALQRGAGGDGHDVGALVVEDGLYAHDGTFLSLARYCAGPVGGRGENLAARPSAQAVRSARYVPAVEPAIRSMTFRLAPKRRLETGGVGRGVGDGVLTI